MSTKDTASVPLPEQIRRLENLTSLVWPPAGVQELSGWKLSTDVGITRRANSVLPNRWTGGEAIDSGIEGVERHYASRGLTPCFKITKASLPSDLEERLVSRGYRKEGETDVLVVHPGRLRDTCVQNHFVEQLFDPSEQWALAAGLGDGSKSSLAKLGIAERIVSPRAFLLSTVESQPAGAAILSAVGGTACVSGLHVLRDQRGRGVGRSLMAALAQWSTENGVEEIFLQVEAENTRTMILYERIGWRFAYAYHYRVLAARI